MMITKVQDICDIHDQETVKLMIRLFKHEITPEEYRNEIRLLDEWSRDRHLDLEERG